MASVMVQELSMLVAPALSIFFLLLGALGVLGEALAVGLALWNGVVQLVGWGVGAGRQRGQAWPAALLTGLVNGAFGVVIVVLIAHAVRCHSVGRSEVRPGHPRPRPIKPGGCFALKIFADAWWPRMRPTTKNGGPQ
jgi:hypothetical protein